VVVVDHSDATCVIAFVGVENFAQSDCNFESIPVSSIIV